MKLHSFSISKLFLFHRFFALSCSLFSLVFFLVPNSLNAQETKSRRINLSNYSYYQELTPVLNSEKSLFGKVEITPELWRNSYYKDIRLVQNGIQIPYLRRTAIEKSGKSGALPVEVLFRKKDKEKTTTVLKLPPIPKESLLSGIEVKSNQLFETDWVLFLGSKPEELSEERRGFLYNYDSGNEPSEELDSFDTRKSILQFTSPYYPILRVETINSSPMEFTKVLFEPSESNSENKLEPTLPTPKDNSDERSQSYTFSNSEGFPIRQIKLTFQEKSFNRRFELFALDSEKSFQKKLEGNLFLGTVFPANSVQIFLPETIATEWKLVVHYGDNPPLHLEKILISHPKEELVFRLPETPVDASPLRIYSGFEYSEVPEYDTTGFPSSNDDSMKLATFTPSLLVSNPEKSLSIWEPPISIWVARVLFLLGVLGFSAIGITVFQNWSKES